MSLLIMQPGDLGMRRVFRNVCIEERGNSLNTIMCYHRALLYTMIWRSSRSGQSLQSLPPESLAQPRRRESQLCVMALRVIPLAQLEVITRAFKRGDFPDDILRIAIILEPVGSSFCVTTRLPRHVNLAVTENEVRAAPCVHEEPV